MAVLDNAPKAAASGLSTVLGAAIGPTLVREATTAESFAYESSDHFRCLLATAVQAHSP